MDREQCFVLGYVSRTHGAKCELQFKLDVDNSEDYRALESVFIEADGALIPFFVNSIRLLGKNEAIVSLEDIHDMEQAKRLVGCQIYLPLDILPPLAGKQFYFHEVIDFQLLDLTGVVIGTIKNILDLPGQAKIEIDHHGKDVLIPLVDDLIISIDREKGTFTMDVPEGLLDL